MRLERRALLVLAALGLGAAGSGLVLAHGAGFAQRATLDAQRADSSFARLVARLSEPGGDFDTDNLISNEASYLHVLGKVRQLGVRGGAYIGVGPDQNFSYMAEVRPRVAFIIDIRRDNLLQQLMFKALFARARNRVEYLALLTGRPVPRDVPRWSDRTVEQIVGYVDSVAVRPGAADTARRAVLATVRTFGIPLSEPDLATIARFHNEFIAQGMDLRFTSFRRAPRPYYPTYRQLVLERDLSRRQANYLASEEDFQFLKALQARDAVVPVVGDLAGEHALAAIARHLADRGERVTAFYTSNVEFYLFRGGTFDQFADNVRRLPRDQRGVLIRSHFGYGGGVSHPHAVPGYFSVQLLQSLDSFVAEHEAGGYQTYWDVVTKHLIDPRDAQ